MTTKPFRLAALAAAVGGLTTAGPAADPVPPAGLVRIVGTGPGPTPAAPAAPVPPPPPGQLHLPGGEMVDLTPAVLPGGHGPACEPGAEKEKEKDKEELGGGLFTTGEVLLWRPRWDGTAYALLDARNDGAPQGRVFGVAYDARAGLRVGGGYRLGSGWGVGLTYTYFSSAGEASVAAPAGGVAYPLLTRPGVVDRAQTAAAAADLDLHVFDLDFSKVTEIDKHLTVRSFGGVRFASVDLGVRGRYDGRQARGTEVRADSYFEGAGPTAGAEARWAVGRGLGLFGGFRGGLLYGTFEGCLKETTAPGPGGPTVVTDVADRFTGVTPVAAVQLGGSYQWKRLSVAAGYEVNHWFDVSARPVVGDDFAEGKVARRRENLSIDGVFLRVGYEY